MSDARKPESPARDATAALRQAGGDIRSGAAGLGAEAKDAAARLRDEASGAAQDVKAEGEAVVGAAKERAIGFAEEQKTVGAEQAEGIARAVHRAAEELQDASPQLARYVHEAASSVNGLSQALRERSPGELLNGIEDLARRQPVAFFGAAVLAGFALARFAKSSAEGAQPMGRSGGPAPRYLAGMGQAGSRPGDIATPRPAAMGAPGWVPEPGHPQDGPIPAARPATMAAASLGGAAAQPAAANRTGPQGPAS